MALQFIIGRAGSGKTSYCLDQIRARLTEQPQGDPLIFIVPEQASFMAEYELISLPGITGTLRAQVLSFRRLAWRVMQETGGTARLAINDSGKKLLIHKILQQYGQHLKLFGPSIHQVGFVDQLLELFAEWRRYQVDSETLAQYYEGRSLRLADRATMLEDKLHDLQLIYRRYEDTLAQTWLDGEDYITLLAAQLQHSPYVSQAEVWIDGFHGFTPQELAVIEQLMSHSRNLTITLCVDQEYRSEDLPDELDLFHPTASTMVKLQNMADLNKVMRHPVIRLDTSPLPRYEHSPMLAALEDSLARQSSRPVDIGDGHGVIIREAVSRRAEVEGVARELVRLVRDEGLRWRDSAILLRNMESYSDLLTSVFSEYRIPCFLDQKKSMLHHPLIELIRSVIEVIERNWRYEAIFRCVKTEFMYPLYDEQEDERLNNMRHAMDQMENIVLAYGIQGAHRWKNPWIIMGKPVSERIERCRMMIAGTFIVFEENMRRARNIREMSEALFALLAQLRVPERLEQWSRQAAEGSQSERAREHIQVWGGVVDFLDQLVELLGDEEATIRDFSGYVNTGLESLKLSLVPPGLDQVLIGDIDRTRIAQKKHIFVVGVNDGVIPSRIVEDSVLTEAERETLLGTGLPMADGSRRRLLDEQFAIYSILCLPSHRLWLSYALADEEGKTLLPSPVIHQMRRRFPALSIQLLMAEPVQNMTVQEQINYIAHPSRTLSYLTVQLRKWASGDQISPLWWTIYDWFLAQPEWHDELKRMNRAIFYRNHEEQLGPDTIKQLYGQRLLASVSRMEQYAACPFAHFASYGLLLRERPIFRLAAPDIGQLFHQALSELSQRLMELNYDWADVSVEQLEAWARQTIAELSREFAGDILNSSMRYRYIASKLENIVSRTVTIMQEHARRSAFKPIGLELAFGRGERIPPLIMDLDHGFTMELRGRIDRVDQLKAERGTLLRIIDYKSSQTSLRMPHIYYGLSLQMLTYLDVVLTHAEHWLGEPAIPAGVLYFHVHNPLIQGNNAMPIVKIEQEIRKKFKMRGYVLADADTVREMDSELKDVSGHSNVIPVALKTNGDFYASSSVATVDQWNQLRQHARQTIRKMGNGIVSGDVSIAPYRMGQHIPCTWCKFRSVCQFEPAIAGNDYRYYPTLSKERAWKQIEMDIAQSDHHQLSDTTVRRGDG